MDQSKQNPTNPSRQPREVTAPRSAPRDLNYLSPKRDEWDYWCQHFRIDEETQEQATHSVGYAVMDIEIWLERNPPKNRS